MEENKAVIVVLRRSGESEFERAGKNLTCCLGRWLAGVNAHADWLWPTPSVAFARHRFFNSTPPRSDLVTDRMARVWMKIDKPPLMGYAKHEAPSNFVPLSDEEDSNPGEKH